MDLVLLLVVGWGSLRGREEGLVWGLIGGAMLDFLSAVPFGTTLTAMSLIGLLSGAVRPELFQTYMILPLLTAPTATIIFDLIMLGLLQLLGWPVDWPGLFTPVILPSALLNAAAMPFVYGFLAWLNKRIQPGGLWAK